MKIKLLMKYPNLYTLIRKIYTPFRNIKIRKKVGYYSKKGLLKLEQVNESSNNIFYFGVPIHTNLGDLAQYYCIKRWLKENYKEFDIYEFETYSTYSNKFINMLEKKMNANSIIVFQSGYCTKENHLDHKMHRKIVKKFYNSKIVFFPQTINFFDKNELIKTSKIFNKCSNLIFLARDKKSYQIAKDNFSNAQVMQFPDIVTTLIGNWKVNKSKKEGLLLCLRNDGEKKFDNKLYYNDELLKIYTKIEECDTNSKYEYDYTIKNLESVLKEFIDKLSKYKLIITDRYHGTIFSIISNTMVIVVPTNDHKVKTGVDWFDGIYDTVILKNSPEEAIKEAIKLNDIKPINNKSYFKEEYYDLLKEKIGD